MTARDYLSKQHPEWDSKELERTVLLSCPSDHDILDNPTDCQVMNREYSPVDKLPCDTCWDREVTVYVRDKLGPDDVIEPADKTIGELFKEYEMNKEKENETMPKTKAEFMEELEKKKEEIAAIKVELARLEKYRKYDEAAEETKAIYDAYVRAGFTKEESFTILATLLKQAR